MDRKERLWVFLKNCFVNHWDQALRYMFLQGLSHPLMLMPVPAAVGNKDIGLIVKLEEDQNIEKRRKRLHEENSLHAGP